jgi:hypothetical protein
MNFNANSQTDAILLEFAFTISLSTGIALAQDGAKTGHEGRRSRHQKRGQKYWACCFNRNNEGIEQDRQRHEDRRRQDGLGHQDGLSQD